MHKRHFLAYTMWVISLQKTQANKTEPSYSTINDTNSDDEARGYDMAEAKFPSNSSGFESSVCLLAFKFRLLGACVKRRDWSEVGDGPEA